ncbi:DM13 domain-containing protein [Salininema proteolyticum]|uniref:DM13 domain-containing protein n=1 Tax=Salininema proteolyticum TaxID=1607685 RepID=A0ABV8TVR5_9ACTN
MSKRTIAIIGGLAAAGLIAAAVWFEPWALFTNERVDEELPEVAQSEPSDDPSESMGDEEEEEAKPVQLAAGEFVTQEHDTSGAATVIENPDGSRQLLLEDLATSNGPDLRVWITDQEVDPDEWHVFDNGYWVELGELKGNEGDQVYDIPDDADLDKVTSVSIWCKRFSVSFGAAELV